MSDNLRGGVAASNLTAHQNRFDEPELRKVLPFVLGVQVLVDVPFLKG